MQNEQLPPPLPAADSIPPAFSGALQCEGGFELPIPPSEAFDCFTAEGERAWVPGWEPVLLHGEGRPQAPGTVFVTRHASGTAVVWLVVESDRALGRLAYMRVVEGRQRAFVQVRLARSGDDGTAVRVRYTIEALGQDGAAEAEAFSAPEAFADTMCSWRQMIHGSLAHHSGPT